MRQVLGHAAFYLRRTFILPWHDPIRARLLIASMIGSYAASLLALVLNYSIADQGLYAATAFQIVRFSLLGFVFIPVTFWVLSRPRGRFIVLLAQLCGTLLLFAGLDRWFVCGIGSVMLVGPFWALYSQRYALNQSRDNHGNETALLLYLQTIAFALGTVSGGLFLEAQRFMTAMFLAGAMTMLSTWMYYKKLSYHDEWNRACDLIAPRKPITRLSFMIGTIHAIFDAGLPVWLRLIGIAPLSASVSLALRPILGTLLTPLVGNIIQSGRFNLVSLGAVPLVVGWLLLLVVPAFPGALLPALTLMTIATNVISPAEIGRWYKRRSSAAIMAREFLLGAGRVSTTALLVPLVFVLPVCYPLVGLGVSAAFALGVRNASRSISSRNVFRLPASSRIRL